MKCPYCGSRKDKVLDSRASAKGKSIRRRRACLRCKKRFTTYEYVETVPLLVVKKDGRREAFNREKLLMGVMKACEKRPVSVEKMERLVDDIARKLEKEHEKEVKTKEIGELVMERLHSLDQIAYVRFASVYRQFKDVSEFMKELKHFLK